MRMYPSIRMALVTSVPVALAGCPVNVAPIAQLPPGFTCPVLPTTLSPPGTVYRITPQGVAFTVSVPNPALPLRTSSFGDIISSSKKEVKASLVAKLLKINISGNASADMAYTITQNYKGATFLDTTDQDVQPILDKMKQTPRVANNNYYIVREVMSTTGIEYDFDKDISDSFGADISIKVVQVDPNSSYTNTGKFSYNATFNTPVYACSKAEAIMM